MGGGRHGLRPRRRGRARRRPGRHAAGAARAGIAPTWSWAPPWARSTARWSPPTRAEVADRLDGLWRSPEAARGVRALGTVRRLRELARTRTHLHSPRAAARAARRAARRPSHRGPAGAVPVLRGEHRAGRRALVHRGPLVDAVLASAAVPGLLPPVAIGGEHYLDGGLVQQHPVGPGGRARRRRPSTCCRSAGSTPAATAPRRPWEVATVAFEIARRHRFARDMAACPPGSPCTCCPAGAAPRRGWNSRARAALPRHRGRDRPARSPPRTGASADYLRVAMRAGSRMMLPPRWVRRIVLAPALVAADRGAAGVTLPVWLLVAAAVVAAAARPAGGRCACCGSRVVYLVLESACAGRAARAVGGVRLRLADPARRGSSGRTTGCVGWYLRVLFGEAQRVLHGCGSRSRAPTRTSYARPPAARLLPARRARATRSCSSTRWSTGTTASRASCSRTRCSGTRRSTSLLNRLPNRFIGRARRPGDAEDARSASWPRAGRQRRAS